MQCSAVIAVQCNVEQTIAVQCSNPMQCSAVQISESGTSRLDWEESPSPKRSRLEPIGDSGGLAETSTGEDTGEDRLVPKLEPVEPMQEVKA